MTVASGAPSARRASTSYGGIDSPGSLSATVMTSSKKPDLPKQGDAFAFPIGDGRFSVCRVLLDATSDQAKQYGSKAVLVACSSWIGNEASGADEASLRPILTLTHHFNDNYPHVLWIGQATPQDFISIGIINPTSQEQAILCNCFGGWKVFTSQPLLQWQWDNDRGAVLAADKVREEQESKKRRQEVQNRKKYLANVSLDDLHDHLFFARWQDYPSPKAIRAARAIMQNAVDDLLEVGLHASKKERLAILKQCIKSFNELDEELHFIETVAREDICEEFEAIVHACGLGAMKDLADRWREW